MFPNLTSNLRACSPISQSDTNWIMFNVLSDTLYSWTLYKDINSQWIVRTWYKYDIHQVELLGELCDGCGFTVTGFSLWKWHQITTSYLSLQLLQHLKRFETERDFLILKHLSQFNSIKGKKDASHYRLLNLFFVSLTQRNEGATQPFHI